MNPAERIQQFTTTYPAHRLYAEWGPVTVQWCELPEKVIEQSVAHPERTVQRLVTAAGGGEPTIEQWHLQLGSAVVSDLVGELVAKQGAYISGRIRAREYCTDDRLEDALQDATVRVLERNPFAVLHGAAAAAAAAESPFLLGALVKEGCNAVRRYRTRDQHAGELEHDPAANPTSDPARVAEWAELCRSIAAGPIRERAAAEVVLEEITIEQAVAQAGVSRATVYRDVLQVCDRIRTLAQNSGF